MIISLKDFHPFCSCFSVSIEKEFVRTFFKSISSVCFFVLVNNSPMGFFSNSRCLKQGDPLSPLLFVIFIEALSKMISATVNGGFL
jgi:hypothetical protein